MNAKDKEPDEGPRKAGEQVQEKAETEGRSGWGRSMESHVTQGGGAEMRRQCTEF